MRIRAWCKYCQGLLLLAVIALVAGDLAAQIFPGEGMESGLGGNNIISGIVTGPDGRITRRIQVKLTTMTRGDRIATTDDSGNFVFRGIPSGSYTIVIDKEKDFEPFAQNVEVIQLRGAPSQTYNVSVRLVPKPGSDGRAAVVNSAFAGVPSEARAHFEKAQGLAKTDDLRGAVEQLKLAVAAYPDFMMAYSELGVLYLRLAELEKADEALVAATKIDPDAFAPLLNRGIVLIAARRYSEAAPVLKKAVKLNNENIVGHFFLGQALANLGLFDEAEKELVIAVSKGGEEMKEGHRILGIIYNSRGDKKRAIESIEAYLKLAPSAPDAEQLRAAIAQWKAKPE